MPATLQEIREAFTQAGGASNLTPKVISRLLNELVRKYIPLETAIPTQTWTTDVFYFNKRTGLPKSQATTEAPSTTDVAPTSSVYSQVNFPIKHIQSQIDVSTFAAKVATVNGNLFDLELKGAAQSLNYLAEMFHMYGSAGATLNTKRPAWDGLDTMIANSNKVDGATQTLSLNMLDNCIDAVKSVYAGELGTDFFFCMSPRMESRLNGLFVNQQRFNQGMTRIFKRTDFGDPDNAVADSYIDAGLEVGTYRSIPVVLSSLLSNQGTMTTVTATGNTGSGATLGNSSTYYYVVEAVTRYGLTAASAEVSQVPSASGNNVVLTWTTPAPTDTYGNVIDVLFYRIHRSTASGGESLYAIVSALDNNDSPIVTFTDTGLPINPVTTANAYAITVASFSGNAVPDGVTFPRVQSGTQIVEDIFLVPRNPEFLVSPEVNPLTTQLLAPVNARTRQFAITADRTLALRAPGFAAKLGRVRAF